MDILTFIADSTVARLSTNALVALTVIMILTDRLIPRRAHLREVAELRSSRDAWKEAHRVSEEARQEQGNQLNKFLEKARVSIAEPAPKRSHKNVSDVVA